METKYFIKQTNFERKDEGNLQNSRKLLEDLSKGVTGSKLLTSDLEGLQVVAAHEGFFLCHFLVPSSLLDHHGKRHVGAIATLIDCIGGAVALSFSAHVKASIEFSISYISKAKFQEEIEIEAKVLGNHGKLIAFVVEVRKKSSGELVAVGKQWMTANKIC